MTKKKADKSGTMAEKETEKMYVILRTISYKSMIPEEREIIHPAPDPYAADAPRISLEHLGPADINRLIMRKVVAPYDPEEH